VLSQNIVYRALKHPSFLALKGFAPMENKRQSVRYVVVPKFVNTDGANMIVFFVEAPVFVFTKN
jgi:hypothetical protein